MSARKKLGTFGTVLATFGAIANNQTYKGRFSLLIDYLFAGLAYLRAGWGPTEVRQYRCAGLRIASCHPRSFFTTFKEIFIEECYFFNDMPERPFIVDCGANIGMATCFFKKLRPLANISAVEPSPATVQILTRNLRQNKIEGVKVIAAAVSDREGEALFDEEYPSGVSNKLSEHGTSAVKLLRLSSLVDQTVDLLKIDTEGVEINILQEMEDAGKLDLVSRIVTEYGLNESSEATRLSPLLALLERNAFRYVIDARSNRLGDEFQSVIVRAWRSSLQK